MKFAHAMMLSGQAVCGISPFVSEGLHFIFRRISHGATRSRRHWRIVVAASKYGPGAFEEGLKHVVRKSVEFHNPRDN